MGLRWSLGCVFCRAVLPGAEGFSGRLGRRRRRGHGSSECGAGSALPRDGRGVRAARWGSQSARTPPAAAEPYRSLRGGRDPGLRGRRDLGSGRRGQERGLPGRRGRSGLCGLGMSAVPALHGPVLPRADPSAASRGSTAAWSWQAASDPGGRREFPVRS